MLDWPQPDTPLLTIRQRKGGSLSDFVDWFKQQKLRIYNLDEIIAIIAFCSRVQHAKCVASIHKKGRANWLNSWRGLPSTSGFIDDEFARAKQKREGSYKGPGKKPKLNHLRGGWDQAPMTFAPLSRPIQEVMAVAKAQNLKKRGKLKSPPERKD